MKESSTSSSKLKYNFFQINQPQSVPSYDPSYQGIQTRQPSQTLDCTEKEEEQVLETDLALKLHHINLGLKEEKEGHLELATFHYQHGYGEHPKVSRGRRHST